MNAKFEEIGSFDIKRGSGIKRMSAAAVEDGGTGVQDRLTVMLESAEHGELAKCRICRTPRCVKSYGASCTVIHSR